MIADDHYCVGILKQTLAIQGAIEQVNTTVLEKHLRSCVTNAIRGSDRTERERVIGELMDVFKGTGPSSPGGFHRRGHRAGSLCIDQPSRRRIGAKYLIERSDRNRTDTLQTLAQADFGITMGGGTDIAMESADINLVRDDLRSIASAIEISRSTLRKIRRKLFRAFAYNIVLIPVAAGVLVPTFGIQLSPMLAAGAMGLSSLSVVTNSLRLKRASFAR